MAMGSSPPPDPQPVTPVPQEDDPNSLVAKQRAAARAAGQEGASAHLLNGSEGVTSDPEAEKRKLLGGSAALTS